MEYRTLGRTGIQVSPLGLGTMMFGAWGNTDHDESVAIIHAALDAGINLVDTADMYAQGESEEIVGRALVGRRDDVVLATKVHHPMGDGVNTRGNSRRWIVRAAEDSLRRLRTDHIDLYQVHRPDPHTDIDETLGALTDLVRQGKIRNFGTSTFPAAELVEAQWVAERRNRDRFVTEQPPYSILARAVEADVLPVTQRYGLGVLTWAPLAGGWLTGRYRRGAQADTHRARYGYETEKYDATNPANAAKLDAVEALTTLAADSGLSLIHLSLAFVKAHPAVTAPLIGPRTMEQLKSQLGAMNLTLPDDILDRIDDIVPPGTTLVADDAGYTAPPLSNPALRRR